VGCCLRGVFVLLCVRVYFVLYVRKMNVEPKAESAELVSTAAAPAVLGMLPQEEQPKMDIDAPSVSTGAVVAGAPEDIAGAPAVKSDVPAQMTMNTDMLVNATGSLEPKIAYHAGEVVVLDCPSPDAFWLGIAVKNIAEIDEATRNLIEEQEQQEAMGAAPGMNPADGLSRLAGAGSAELNDSLINVPIKWLVRIASFENGDDLYRAGREERVKRSRILCLAHVTLMENDPFTGGHTNHYVVTMAERHRLIRFIANGDENTMEDSDDGDIVDGVRVAALVSRATVNNTAFFLVKWDGFEYAAMTWEPMILLTQCCPDLVAHFDDAPYKLAIQFPNSQPMPAQQVPQDGGIPISNAPGTPDAGTPMNRSGRGRQGGRGRGRGAKVKSDRVPVTLSPAPVPVISDPTPPPPPPPMPVPPADPQPQPYFGTPATLTDTSKGPIPFSQLSSIVSLQQDSHPQQQTQPAQQP